MDYNKRMRILSKSTIDTYSQKYPNAADQLADWYARLSTATITDFAALKAAEPTASVVNVEWVVFNIAGSYRLITRIYYPANTLFIKDFLTHADYDTWSQVRRESKKSEEAQRAQRAVKKKHEKH